MQANGIDNPMRRSKVIYPLRRRLKYVEKNEHRGKLYAMEMRSLLYTLEVIEQHFKNLERENQAILRLAKERSYEDS